MKRYYIIIFILLLCPALKAEQQIFLDNKEIQEYKGKLGIWISLDSRQSIQQIVKKISNSVEEVYNINGIGNHFIKNYYFIPYSDNYINELQFKNISRNVITSNEEEFIWPVEGAIEASSVLGFRYGKFHPGMDLPAVAGTPIVAAMEGVVTLTGYAEGYGRTVIIEHRNNYTTKYAHNYVNFVKKGDFVKKGQIIGLVGSTGNSTGNHLHFEIRCKEIPLDPIDFLPQKENLRVIHTLKNWK